MKYLKCSEDTHALAKTLSNALNQSMQELADQSMKLLAEAALGSGKLSAEWRAIVEKSIRALAGRSDEEKFKRKQRAG